VEIIIESIKSVGLIAITAYPLTRYSMLRRSLSMILSMGDKVKLAIIFGVLSILANASGTEVFNGALLSSRVTGPVIGGLIAGPFVGVASGVIGGIHRYTLGGFTAIPDLFSTVIGGIVGGLFYRYYGENRFSFLKACFAGIAAGLLEIIFIAVFAKPSILAFTLIGWISPANLIVNALGIGIFVSILKNVQYSQYSIGASYAEIATAIAQRTLPVVKGELDARSAQEIVDIIFDVADFGAVSITDGIKVLAFRGAGNDHHNPGTLILQNMDELSNQEVGIANSRLEISCPHKECPLDSVIVVALGCGDERVGNLEVYKIRDVIHPPDVKLVTGIAELLSSQLYIARLRQKEQLLSKAEYDALRSQINPHFLFNSLSVIKLLIRTDPAKAQNLILALASFFRKTLKTVDDIIPFAEEIKCIEFYLTIQQARFGDRLNVEIMLEPECMEIPFPAFALQPLVENSMNHGLSSIKGVLNLVLTARIIDNKLIVKVEDNGVGIPQEVIEAVKKNKVLSRMGVGLTNINRRLKSIFGKNYLFILENRTPGASAEIHIPAIALKGGK